MKVKDLIEKLQTFDKQLDVVVAQEKSYDYGIFKSARWFSVEDLYERDFEFVQDAFLDAEEKKLLGTKHQKLVLRG